MKFKTRVTTDFSCWIAISILSIFLMGGTAVYAQSDSNNSGSATNAADTLQVDLMFVLDNSGSMIQNDPKFITREVVTNTLNSLTQNFRVGMVVFDKDARLVQALTAVDTQAAKNTIAAKLDRINYRGQFTNTPAAVERAVYELKTNGREEAKKAIILLTDGIVDTGNKDQDLEGEKWLKEDLAAESKKAGIRIFGVAFTDTADFRLMQSLALQTEGEYFRAYSIDDIQSIFNSIEDILRKPSETLKEKAAVEIAEPGTIVIEKPVPVALPNTPAEPEPAPKSNLPLSILLAGLVAIVIIFVILLFMRRMPTTSFPIHP
ncbi:MAG: VWA domain-containing protein [Deltaproteobacteria bacterium]